MEKSFSDKAHFPCVSNFQDLITKAYSADKNALCWKRELQGDFSEIVDKIEFEGNMIELEPEVLLALKLSELGQLARKVILSDLKLLEDYGAAPVLNLIKCYEQDDSYPFFPTDVYSFHVDRSPVPTDTFLCTYQGAASEIILNTQAEQKVLVPEIREELMKLHGGEVEGFEDFLSEFFFDLHYRAKDDAEIVGLGTGNLWKLAVDHPKSKVLPCVHRAPREDDGKTRLMLIC
jgi:hypothetical protein